MKLASALILLALLPGCAAADQTGQSDGSTTPTAAGDGSGEAGTPVDRLPLRRGFYVATDTACGQASNATLTLLGRDSLNGARDSCEFKRITRLDAQRYLVDQVCTDLPSGEGAPSQVLYTVDGDAAFSAHNRNDDWTFTSRHCPQPELPEPWRDIALDDAD